MLLNRNTDKIKCVLCLQKLKRSKCRYTYLWNRAYCMDLFSQFAVGLKKQQQLKVEFVESLTELQLLKVIENDYQKISLLLPVFSFLKCLHNRN